MAKGINFTEQMFRNVIDGTKTQTRRIVKGQPKYEIGDICRVNDSEYTVEITDIRCERLQDISDEDCLAEGIMTDEGAMFSERNYDCCKNCGGTRLYNTLGSNYGIIVDCDCYDCDDKTFYCYDLEGMPFPTPQSAYAALIDSIYGQSTWESNPYVWVYSFKLLDKEGGKS